MEELQNVLNEIVVEKKNGEFYAHLKGKSGKWAQGITVMQAVGTLICDHPKVFHIHINYENVDSLIPTKK